MPGFQCSSVTVVCLVSYLAIVEINASCFLTLYMCSFFPCDKCSTRLNNVAPQTIGAIYAIDHICLFLGWWSVFR